MVLVDCSWSLQRFGERMQAREALSQIDVRKRPNDDSKSKPLKAILPKYQNTL